MQSHSGFECKHEVLASARRQNWDVGSRKDTDGRRLVEPPGQTPEPDHSLEPLSKCDHPPSTHSRTHTSTSPRAQPNPGRNQVQKLLHDSETRLSVSDIVEARK